MICFFSWPQLVTFPRVSFNDRLTHEVSLCNRLSPDSTCFGSRWLIQCIDMCSHLTSLLMWENSLEDWSKPSQSVAWKMLVLKRGWMTFRTKSQLCVTSVTLLRWKSYCNSLSEQLQPDNNNHKTVLLSTPWKRQAILYLRYIVFVVVHASVLSL